MLAARDYYKGAKRVSIGGVPTRVPKWFNTLGTDAEAREALRPRGIKEAYYSGGHRLTIDGAPVRVALHVKTWKPGNRAALGQGFDPFGLSIRPHGKRGFTRRDRPDSYWERWYEATPLERYFSAAECCDLINSNEYRKWRPTGAIFQARQELERRLERERDRADLGVNLWQWARIVRRKTKSQKGA